MERDRIVKIRVLVGFDVFEGIEPLFALRRRLSPEYVTFEHFLVLVDS